MKISGLIFGLLAFVAVRYYIRRQYNNVMTEVTSGGPASCLTMMGSTTRDENHFTYIVGSFRNDCARQVGQVTVIFKVSGPEDRNHYSRDAILYAYERDIEPGEVRNFKTMFQAGKNAVFRFDHFNAY